MSGMHGFGLTDPVLSTLYTRTKGPVAFIDESYREPLRNNERPFYMMSAVIVGRNQGSLIRDVLMDIPGSRYWHTTEAYRTEPGKRVIAEMIDYLAEAVDYNIITVQSEVRREDPGMHQARDECLGALAKEVTRGSGSNAVRLMVLESRNINYYPHGDRDDNRVLTRLSESNAIDPSTRFHHTSPGKEPLLWAADLSVWAFRRQVAVGDNDWFAPLEDISTVLHVDGPDVSVKRSNPHLPQPSPGVQPVIGHVSDRNRGGEPVVASRPSLVFAGAESEQLARIRAIAARAGRTVEQEIVHAVGTDDPKRLIAAANVYLRQVANDPARVRPKIEESLTRSAETILPETGADRVKAALEALRQRRAADTGPGPEAPEKTKDRRQGYQR
ncbi:hypothetical protein IV498_10280 [Paenarthrobacter sp. Z7-10]|uniref:hypothetical protein n=1 Tax=Paenarthrobacter sp. Z7-10 TaxID=2787635 RepID=UPI0022A9C68C|nr:hypothetical protein [Paenarthrobacter sp. Z7-10]MCZ2403557.1 hypothetical protein [Paenarthrobacter sp. Z7-10]